MSKEKPLNPLTMTDEELIEHCDKQVQALRMALDMIECEKHDRRHVRWAIVDALKEWKPALAQQPAQQEPVAWKPIETAPKDAMVLVCLPRQMNLVVRAWYNSIHNFWQTDYEGEGGITRPIYFHEGDLWHPIPPLYTTPPQRKPLTYVDLRRIANQCGLGANEVSARTQATIDNFARAIEAAHGIL